LSSIVVEPFAGFGAKTADTPLGSAETEKVVDPQPAGPSAFTDAYATPPGASCTLAGPDKVRSGATVSETVVVAVCDPRVPLTVTVVVPTAAVLLAEKLMVAAWFAGFTGNEAVTPAGNPLTDKVTLPVKP
jgi:hypothetical protein